MKPEDVPEEIISRFRSASLERIEQIEASWLSISQSGSPRAGAEVLRLLHTLKGDARIVGFVDVHFLCHKLEELITFAHRYDYRVTDDIDLLVTMGVRFLAVLLRKRMGQYLGGIDLHAFSRQIDEVLLDAQLALRRDERPPSILAPGPPLKAKATVPDRLCSESLADLSCAAALLYVEMHRSASMPRDSLVEAWRIIRNKVEALGRTSLPARLERHEATAASLARDLGKEVVLETDVNGLSVSAEVASALDIAVLHGLRNAVDHGIEAPHERKASGKLCVGHVWISALQAGDFLRLEVRDDGRGIDPEAVRARAVERGVPGAADADTQALMEMLFLSGFSTRRDATELSGRGLGLDAVRAAARALGGDAWLESEPGRGALLIVDVVEPPSSEEVWRLEPSGSELSVCVPASWALATAAPHADAIDPLTAVGLDTAAPAAAVTVSLQRGKESHHWRVAKAPERCVIERRLRTRDTDPMEVVRIGDEHALLLRPDRCGRAPRR